MPVHEKAKAAATYVQFERDMFNRVVKAIQGLTAGRRADSQGGERMGDPQQFQKNVLLASFLIHTRNLRDFLFPPRRPKPDDVLARHFLPDWDESVEKLCPYLDANRERLNKSLAHISYKRIEYEPNKDWEYVEIYKELTGAWDEFFSSLPAEKQDWFTEPRNQSPVRRL